MNLLWFKIVNIIIITFLFVSRTTLSIARISDVCVGMTILRPRLIKHESKTSKISRYSTTYSDERVKSYNSMYLVLPVGRCIIPAELFHSGGDGGAGPGHAGPARLPPAQVVRHQRQPARRRDCALGGQGGHLAAGKALGLPTGSCRWWEISININIFLEKKNYEIGRLIFFLLPNNMFAWNS